MKRFRKARSNKFIPKVRYEPTHIQVVTYPEMRLLQLMKPIEYDDKHMRIYVCDPNPNNGGA